MNRKFFFIHNPKAGGSAIRNLILNISNDKKICPTFSNSPNSNDYSIDKIEKYSVFDLFFGHWGYDVFEKIGNDGILITNFRNPVDRIFSLYRYWRNNVNLDDLNHLDKKDYMCVEFAKKNNFSEFIRIDMKELNLYIQNFHCRQLHSNGWNFIKFDEIIIEKIKYRIEKMNWFYITENPVFSMFLFRKEFPQFQQTSLLQENVSNGQYEKISDEDVSYLMSLNYWDYEIYTYAWHLQSERMKKFINI